jgi:uncharacterized protein YpmS
MTENPKNRSLFKWAFFTLAAINVILLILAFVFVMRLVGPIEDNHFVETAPIDREATFTIETTKSKLNGLIANQIEEQDAGVPYVVELGDEFIQFRSEFNLLGQRVPLQMDFKPEVSKNGDVLLLAESVSVGILQLPQDRAMQLIRDYAELPEWVEIHPTDRLAHIKVTEIEVDPKLDFRARTINLKEDEIVFEMLVNE